MSEHNTQKIQKQSFVFGLVAGVAAASIIGLVIVLSAGFNGAATQKGAPTEKSNNAPANGAAPSGGAIPSMRGGC